jgi:TOMM system kinase/cyclase fusion protein
MIGKTILHYKIIEKLGEGGMGVVYKAEDTKLKRIVALKFLPSSIKASEEETIRLVHEAQVAAALNHPNICTIYEIDEADGQSFIAMEFVEGQSLQEKIKAGPLKIDEAIKLAMQIAEGLQAAHEKDITHRDIKGANIMITGKGQAKIMDFGLAKLAGQKTRFTKTGMTVGTVAYMSPEQIQGFDADARSDIFSFGVVLYEMLTGHLPFRGEYEAALMYSILNEEPAPISSTASGHANVPEELERLVNRALAKKAQDRYQTMLDLITALKEIAIPSALSGGAPQEAKLALEKTASKSPVSTSERRQATAMFCDLIVTGTVSKQLDPEDIHEVLPAYRQLCQKVIARFDGHVTQHLGEDMLVYFGYPTAHEDSPRRAVLAGLGILEGVQRLSARLIKEKGLSLSVRIGIHTGLVIVGDHAISTGVIGEVSDIANQLQLLIDTDSLVISQSTYRLIEGYFDCRELGAYTLRGLSQPMTVYQVLHESAARSRLEAAGTPALTLLTGRGKEIGMLVDRWQQTVEGMGQVVLLSGEAGIGKSRLVREIKAHVASNPEAWLTECFCSPYFQSTALYPIIDLIEHTVLQFEKETPAAEKLEKLEGFLLQYGFALPETVPLFAPLLNVPLGENYAVLNLTPERQKQKTLAALLNLLVTRASQQPILFIIEDLHWADPTSLEWLNLIIDQGPTTHCLTLLTFRPDFAPPWPMRSHIAYMTLSRLPRHEIENMAVHVAKAKTLPKEVLAHIVSKTDGVPLFVEELIKTLLETGVVTRKNGTFVVASALAKLAIPATLRDSLMARLDRLGTAKEVAQLGATLGREFPHEWLQAVSPLEEPALQTELERLVEAELLFRRGVPPQATYIFKHALIQEAAYESLLKSTRLQYHQKIAQSLATRFPETADSKPEWLAHHYTAAGRLDQAIPLWQKAGQQATQRSANAEAATHFMRALELVKSLPDSPEKIQQELVLQITLGPVLMAVKGYAAPEVEAAYRRAREICQQIGETPQIVMVLFGLWAFYVVRGNLKTARELGEQIVRLVESSEDSGVRLEAHIALGVTLYFLGEFVAARGHLEQAIAIYDPAQHRAHAMMFGQEPGMASRIYLAKTLWILGYPDFAGRYQQEALAIAQETSHPHTTAFCLTYAMLIKNFRGEEIEAQQLAEQTLTLSNEQGFPIWSAAATVVRGWADSHQTQNESSLEQIRQGIAAWKATGTNLYAPYWWALLANAQLARGKIEEAKAAIDTALSLDEQGEEHLASAEIYRLKGETLLRDLQDTANDKLAEQHLQKALAVARQQSAKSWELRLAISLARLWRKQGQLNEARQLLQDTYAWFTEGFATKDLREAKALMEEMP